MSNGCKKESSVANLFTMSKKATELLLFTLFYSQSVFKRLTDSATDLVVTMGIWIEGNHFKRIDIDLAILHVGLFNRGSHNLSNHAKPICLHDVLRIGKMASLVLICCYIGVRYLHGGKHLSLRASLRYSVLSGSLVLFNGK